MNLSMSAFVLAKTYYNMTVNSQPRQHQWKESNLIGTMLYQQHIVSRFKVLKGSVAVRATELHKKNT